jgi:hypothetical protein
MLRGLGLNIICFGCWFGIGTMSIGLGLRLLRFVGAGPFVFGLAVSAVGVRRNL